MPKVNNYYLIFLFLLLAHFIIILCMTSLTLHYSNILASLMKYQNFSFQRSKCISLMFKSRKRKACYLSHASCFKTNNKSLSIFLQVAQVLYGAHVVDDDRSLRDNICGIGHVEFRDDTCFGWLGDHDSMLYPTFHGSYETTSRCTTKSPFQLGSLVRW